MVTTLKLQTFSLLLELREQSALLTDFVVLSLIQIQPPQLLKQQHVLLQLHSKLALHLHFDEGESLVAAAAPDLNKGENVASARLEANEGYGYSGFYMAYWIISC